MNDRALGGLLLILAGAAILWGVFHGWFDVVTSGLTDRLAGKQGSLSSSSLLRGAFDSTRKPAPTKGLTPT